MTDPHKTGPRKGAFSLRAWYARSPCIRRYRKKKGDPFGPPKVGMHPPIQLGKVLLAVLLKPAVSCFLKHRGKLFGAVC